MKEWSNLAKVVYARTYAREDSGKLENWEDTVDRIIKGNTKNFKVTKEEKDRLKYFILNRKAMPAGRGLWFSGAVAHDTLGGAALCNCWYFSMDNWRNFVLTQDLLMLGGGVGAGVEHRFVSKLPKIKKDVKITHSLSKDANFIVPDSREGWNELLTRCLESFFETGKSFSYSTICLRDYGSPIKGFGGKASGAAPLISFIEKLQNIFKLREGKNLKPLDVADTICAIGEMVVAGNVRRSAIIILGDPWDKDYLKAKRWDLGVLPSYRAMANFSVVCDDVDDLHPLYWKTYEAGEAFGLFNRTNAQLYARIGEKKKDSGIGVNPCVTGDTEILTSNGYVQIQDTVDKEVEIWNGFEWSKVIPKITGYNQPLINIKFNNGSELTCTEYHKFFIHNKDIRSLDKTLARNLEVGMQLIDYNTPQFFKNKYPTKNIQITSITSAGMAKQVYCFNEPIKHLALFNGVVTGQCSEAVLESGEPCNLQELFLPNLEDKEEFKEAAILMHRWGKRVTCEKYHNKENDEVVKRNRRIGTGITGCLQSELFNKDTLNEVFQAIEKENTSYSKELGIPESIRNTVIKPSGTLSLIGDCTPGIHASFSRYYIRRVRFASNDKLISILKEAGHYMEPVQNLDGTLDHKTLVVDFYCKTPEGTPCVDEGFDTWRQLDTLLFAQRYWADQSVSVTVYYKKEEINQIKAWLALNLKNLKTISFLCYNDHGFKQAPIEAISEEKYNKLIQSIKTIKLDNIGNGEMETLECEGGVCPIK